MSSLTKVIDKLMEDAPDLVLIDANENTALD
jgi:hypothetical protein